MINAVSKSIFYVSNLGTDKVSIIDGENWSIIDEIQVGPRPYEIDVDNKNNIYIATDRNNRVTIIDNMTKTNKSVYIPNNGHIKVDSISQKIYVSNTEEICIYNLYNAEIIDKISGFMIVDSIELNNDGSKLFVLDILQNEVKIYDTFSFKLIKTYRNIGDSPNSIFIGDNDRYLYISNKGINKTRLNGNIVVVDLNNDSSSNIELPNGSIPTAIEGYSRFLYVINSGLNRIEIIDAIENSIIGTIKTSLSDPQRVKISKDKKFLLVTSRDNKGRGALDIIDIENKMITNSFDFKEKNTKPYDVVVISEDGYKTDDFLYNNLNDKLEANQETVILANKVLSTYKEKIIFQQEKIELISEDKIEVEEIRFENCKVVDESKNREFVSNKENYIVLNYEFIIPYYIRCINSEKEKLIIKGNLKGRQRAILYISDNSGKNDLEFTIKSSSEVIYSPYIKDNFIIFDVSSIISTYVTKEKLIFVPSREIDDKLKEV